MAEITYTRQDDYNLPDLKLPRQSPRESVFGDNAAGAISENNTRFSTIICSPSVN